MSAAGDLVDDIYAVVPDLDMPIRVNVVGDDTDLHVIDITVNPSDGIVRIIVESGEEATVDPPAQPAFAQQAKD